MNTNEHTQTYLQPLSEAPCLMESKRAALDLAASELRYRRLFESAKDGILILDATTGMIVDVNPFLTELLGYSRDQFLGKRVWELGFLKHLAANADKFAELQAREYVRYENLPLETADGQVREVEFVSNVYLVEGKRVIQCNIRDITERKRTEEKMARLYDQLSQARKIEAIGLLAGGVAHEFNNMLMVIIGNVSLCRDHIGQAQPVREWLDEIMIAAKRSAETTRQLLAFARKQVSAPQILDLNYTVTATLTLMRRLIGEDIELIWNPGANLWQTKIDPSQINQILSNLLINARDAIAGVGRVTLATENIRIDSDYARTNDLHATPGDYVMLTVSDTGQGMDKDVQTRIFEPFYTTKGMGKGTGLGLATVYGIVDQNNGCISVNSEQNKGTIFKVHLPRVIEETTSQTDAATHVPPPEVGETILLVEDEESVRVMCERFLNSSGYKVISAESPLQALEIAGRKKMQIHLLLSDVIMPEMNGREMARQISGIQPAMKTLFMSGYPAEIISHRGLLKPDTAFISKPFSRDDLIRKVTEVMKNGKKV